MSGSFKLTITDTAYRGNGVGRCPDGKALFVPYTVTGDEIMARVLEDKGSYAVGEMLELLKASPSRVSPHCKHHALCGGCHFGHIDYSEQLKIKSNILLQALRKHPQHSGLGAMLQVFSAEPLGYRTRASVRVLGESAGFFKTGSNEFIPVDSCPVIKPSLWQKCCEWAKALSPEKLLTLSVMENPKGEAIAHVEGDKLYPAVCFSGISNGEKHSGVAHLEYDTAAGVVPIGYNGFFQANIYLNDTFQGHASKFATGCKSVLELYAGSGFFTAALMAQGCDVHAMELNANAARLGRKYGYPVQTANVTEAQKEKAYYDMIFMDPPRDGVDKKTLAAVLGLAPKKIVYVSCNPMTAARDLIRMSDKYSIENIALFDLFPHTYHMESVTVLQRIGK